MVYILSQLLQDSAWCVVRHTSVSLSSSQKGKVEKEEQHNITYRQTPEDTVDLRLQYGLLVTRLTARKLMCVAATQVSVWKTMLSVDCVESSWCHRIRGWTSSSFMLDRDFKFTTVFVTVTQSLSSSLRWNPRCYLVFFMRLLGRGLKL